MTIQWQFLLLLSLSTESLTPLTLCFPSDLTRLPLFTPPTPLPTLPPSQVIGFDMGGTSTDVSRYAGSLEHVFESTTAGVTIQAPQLDISTVAAGGGSRLVFRSGVFLVGPEFVGAHPGPLCYRKGGSLAVTGEGGVDGGVATAAGRCNCRPALS